jgi:hypothetical protein
MATVRQGKITVVCLGTMVVKDLSFHSFGVCCLFLVNSATPGTISTNCTYIQNPGYPSAYTATSNLAYTVSKSSSGDNF